MWTILLLSIVLGLYIYVLIIHFFKQGAFKSDSNHLKLMVWLCIVSNSADAVLALSEMVLIFKKIPF